MSSEEKYDEVWKVIIEYPDYFASNLGRIKSTKFNKEKILKPFLNRGGYYNVSIYRNGIRIAKRVHKLVFEAFNGSLSQFTFFDCVDHIDRNKLNNKLSNLRRSNAKLNNTNRGNGYYKHGKSWKVCVEPRKAFNPNKPTFKNENDAKKEGKRRKDISYMCKELLFDLLEDVANITL